MYSYWILTFAALFIVSAGEDAADEILGAAKKAIPDLANTLDGIKVPKNLPGGLSLDALPTSLNMSAVPNIMEGEELLKEKCLKNGKNGSFENAMLAKDELQYCLKGLVNFEEIQKEIEKAKPTGDLDVVFRKYCRKSPHLKDCVNNFTSEIEPCLDPSERISKTIITNITDSLVKFICYKEGDRIALFIAEGGPECLTDKQEAIQQCINSTFTKYLPEEELPDVNNLPLFKMDEPQCLDVNALQKCVVTELEKCSEPTPANIVDSLFNYVRQNTPCAQYKPEGVSSAISVNAHVLTTVVAASLALRSYFATS